MESYLLDSFKLSEDQDLVELQASLKSAPFEKKWIDEHLRSKENQIVNINLSFNDLKSW